MNKIKNSFIALFTIISFISCSKKDEEPLVYIPPVPYDEQYAIDSVNIEEYLNSNSVTWDANYNVTVTKITDPTTQPSIMSYQGNVGFPKLLFREVYINEIVYKLYYLVIREGIGENPMNVDNVLTAYTGNYLTSTTTDGVFTQNTTLFESIQYPNSFTNLLNVIRGWKEIFPQFKTGTYASDSVTGEVIYNNYGVGMMFIPSGLAYYNRERESIPSYSPLIFSFKLFALERLDSEYTQFGNVAVADPDGILSINEDINGDGYVWTASELDPGVVNPDDTDGDGIPDFLDKDDDGDNYTTKLEIKNPLTGKAYPFDEIPTCSSGKKNYIDKSCHL